MQKWLFGLLIIGLLLLGCTLSISDFGIPDIFDTTASELVQNATETVSYQLTTTQHASGFINTQNAPDPFQQTATALIRWATELISTREASTPDTFQLSATRLIANATQTGVAFENAGCTQVLRPVWNINETANREMQIIEVYAESYNLNTWICDGELVQTSVLGDYRIRLVTFEDTITIEVAAKLVERALKLIAEYPPDDTMLSPISIYLYAFPHVPDFNPVTDFVLNVNFTYEDAIAAYESGLRGMELLDVLRIEVPE
jgi:hypothetical protein